MSAKKVFSTAFVRLVSDNILRWYMWLFGICMAIALGAILLTSLFNVPMGDDYLAIHTFASLHQLPDTTLHALTHTGRYTQSITSALAYGLLQNWAPVCLSLFVILLSFFIIRKYMLTLLSSIGISRANLATNLVSGIALIAIMTLCQPLIPKSTFYMYQAFYFSSAIVTYTIAWLATLALLHWFFFGKHANRKHSLILVGLLLYVIFLSNETLPASLVIFSVLAYGISFLGLAKRSIGKQRDLLITICGSGFLALLSMFFSSGNTTRRSELAVRHDQSTIVSILGHIGAFLNNNLLTRQDCLFVLLCGITTYLLLRPLLLKKGNTRIFLYTGLGSLLFFAVSLSTSIALLVYGYGPYTATLGRALLLPIFSFYVGCVALITYGMSSGERWILQTHRDKIFLIKTVFVLLIAVASLYALPLYLGRVTDHLRTAVNYETLWRTENEILRQQAATNPTARVIVPDSFSGIGDGFNLRCKSPYSTWLNVGIATYYEVGSVCSDKNGP